MTKANLEIDFGSLGADEIANAMGLLGAALRGAIVPRNSLTGAIEITEGPDAVEGTATIGTIDAFYRVGYFSSLNIDGTLITARTLLPVIPLFFTRPADATEDQSAVTTWAWPYDLESVARITMVSPQRGGHGGRGGSILGASYPARDSYLTGQFSAPYNDGSVGFFYSSIFLVGGLVRGDEFRFSFGRGGAGGAGGAAATGTPSGSEILGAPSGSAGSLPTGATALLAPGSSSRWAVLPVASTFITELFFGRLASYLSPPNFGTLIIRQSRSSRDYFKGSGDSGAAGLSVITGQGTPTGGFSGQDGSPGLIIIEPMREST